MMRGWRLGADDFAAEYSAIIKSAAAHLRPDRFACVVVGNYRNKKGAIIDLQGITIRAFEAAGMTLHNDAILVTAIGSLPIRAGRQFSASRRLGKTHQNILTFCKGDAKKASIACGEVKIEAIGASADGREETDLD